MRRKGEDVKGDPTAPTVGLTPEEKTHPRKSSNAPVLGSLLVLGLAVGIYFLWGQYHTTLKTADANSTKTKKSKVELFTMEELKRHDGSNPDLPLYLAIIGEVFDVTKGKQHYGPGAGYSFFSGTDGTRAFVTGEFNETGLIPSVEGLPVNQVNDIQGWRDFYHKDYTFMGKLIGYYYDENGKPTENHANFQALLKKHQANEVVKVQWEKVYPSCNSRWAQNEGSEIWCSDQSGGITRGWGGVPRLYVGTEHPKRCVCIDERLLGTFDEKDFEVYADCHPLSPRCKTS